MQIHNLKAILNTTLRVAALFVFGAVAAVGQQVVNLTAAPTTTTLPDGSTVPMWGYFCGAVASTTTTATCAALNPASVSTVTTVPSTWSPVVITVPTGQYLTINLTNSLSFTPTGATTANTVPTSLTIVGQLGGGLGTLTQRTTTPSPSHAGLTSDTVTWSTVGSAPGFTPPPQGARVQSFGTEVAAGATTALTFGSLTNPLRPGTYLIESGTHPSIQGPMGLYGILVVTCAPTVTAGCPTTIGGVATTLAAGTAYPANLNTGVTSAAVTYGAELPLVLSEIDPIQNNSVSAAVNTAGFSETMVWSGQPGGCGNPGSGAAYHTCYPPAVNYTPLYYLINGVALNKTNPSASVFAATPATAVATTSTVLLRVVNAGLRMHVPAVVGSQTIQQLPAGSSATNPTVSGFSIIAEDANPLPGLPRVQNEVLAVPGKVWDLMINVPAATTSPALPIYDRELSLSGNATARDAGMLAYISINGAALPVASGTGVFAPASVQGITYDSVIPCATAPCAALNVSDPGKGVISVDTNVYGVALLTAPTHGTVTLNRNGTFTYTPSAGFAAATTDSFVYCANGSVTVTGTTATCSSPLTATVTLGACGSGNLTCGLGGVTAHNRAYTAKTASSFALKSPGVLGTQYDTTVPSLPVTDSGGYPVSVVVPATPPVCGSASVQMDAEGGFTIGLPATTTAASSCTFPYTVRNTQGKTASATVTVTFPAGSGLVVNVVDGYDKTTVLSDYRWLIEEDRTFYNNPNCTVDTATPAPGCPNQTSTGGVPPILGANFHTSYMPYVAQGCTGTMSCEAGQQVIDTRAGSATLGQPINAVCDVGDGVCRPDTTGNGFAAALPSSVHLDPSKRYYISVLPGDAANPFASAYTGSPSACTSQTSTTCGHGMGGAPIPALCTPATGATTCTVAGVSPYAAATPITILSQPSPYPTAKLSIFVFEDDFPLNGEHDSGGGTGAVNTNNEPGLGQFQIHLWDAFGGNGDFTGQMTYDMFNQPLTNGLAGTIDPTSGLDACPIVAHPQSATTAANPNTLSTDPTANGITGMIVTCPEFEAGGTIPSPLAGQAVVEGLMPGRWGVIATPGADRIARGEEWMQTNTLDGQKAHDSFTRVGEPSYFQEYGPASFHVSIGFANPAIINSRHQAVCNGTSSAFGPGQFAGTCTNTLTGRVVGERLSRTPDERLYGSGSHDAYAWSQCFASFGDPDGMDFIFAKCDADGNFTLNNVPTGDWRLTTFDQWNDQLVDGLSTPVRLPGNATVNIGDVAATQWQTNLQVRTFVDDNADGISQAAEVGIPLLNVAVRLRDGSMENLLLTDFNGTTNFNETFPLFSWYTVETDVTRYKTTGIHVVYDVGGPADGSPSCGVTGYPPCGTSAIGKNLANTQEIVSLPAYLRVPGAVYCATADCTGKSIQNGPSSSDPPSVCTTATTTPFATTCSTKLSSGRIDPPWVGVEGWQGFPGQFSFIEFGKKPYAACDPASVAPTCVTLPNGSMIGENGGIHGHVEYASTRPFDDPQMLVQVFWTPLVPNVTINLYQESFAADGVTPKLQLVDTTKTSSWDDWAQGFRKNAAGTANQLDPSGAAIPNMNCPGQGASTGVIPDLFYYSLQGQPVWLDYYNNVLHGTATATTPLSNASQFKCYDGMHNWNQVEPAPYDGAYSFPSVVNMDPTTGKPSGIGRGVSASGGSLPGTNCTICVPNPDSTDAFRFGNPMLPPGKYVVEIVMPPGYELVKEEDKNILIGDNFIAPVTQQFGGLGNVFIIPDQASVATGSTITGVGYNPNNPQQPTVSLGTTASNNIVPSFVPEPTWPCVGEARVVPQYISLFPATHQVSPFAGATRNLCDRKEVTLAEQVGATAKFYVYTSTHIASKFTGGITDDYTSEFDPFSPTFGEKFSPPDMPVSVKDWAGNEISRVYADHWGSYDGMVFSTWEVNPPNPTGYAPGMMVMCMNDPGPILDTRSTIIGPAGTPIANPTLNQIIPDPLFQVGYSQFCYELPFMPGTTAYLDTPVVPTSAFAGVGYNNVDCAYPDSTPAIAEADGDGYGPWVSAAGRTLTIHSLGDQMVTNQAYAGPSATTAPYNLKTVKRHFGFGSSGTVTIGGVPAPLVGSWSDTTLTVTVPATGSNNRNMIQPCPVQQQPQYATKGGQTNYGTAYCGELVISANVGTTAAPIIKNSVDTVTVTIGGKMPTHVAPTASVQSAIDAAFPGDLLILDPALTGTTAANNASCATVTAPPVPTTCVETNATHYELLVMWKPV
ncbi:MAG: Ig-like domain-containing protein, partial [Candidatus Acidiferrum sp.]